MSRTKPNKPLVLTALLLAAFMINLDTTIVNVALPTLVRELHASTVQLEWIVDAYNLVFASCVLAAGNLGDRVGRKGVLISGLIVFGAASLAGGFGNTPGELIAARAVMGLGAALIFPATLLGCLTTWPRTPTARSARPSAPPLNFRRAVKPAWLRGCTTRPLMRSSTATRRPCSSPSR